MRLMDAFRSSHSNTHFVYTKVPAVSTGLVRTDRHSPSRPVMTLGSIPARAGETPQDEVGAPSTENGSIDESGGASGRV